MEVLGLDLDDAAEFARGGRAHYAQRAGEVRPLRDASDHEVGPARGLGEDGGVVVGFMPNGFSPRRCLPAARAATYISRWR